MAEHVRITKTNIGEDAITTANKYNENVGEWAGTTQRLAKEKASKHIHGKVGSHIYKSGPKAGKREEKLMKHISYHVRKKMGEAESISFKFPRHGIFLEYGVGRGTPANMVGRTKRSKSDWLSASLASQEDKLGEIVADFQGGKVLRTYMGVKK